MNFHWSTSFSGRRQVPARSGGSLLLALLLAGTTPAAGLPELFTGEAAAWRPGPGARPPRAAAGDAPGLEFTCPFQSDAARVFWDRTAELDLGGANLLELDLSCARPAAVRTVGLYLRSGAGWRLWLSPLRETGRQKLRLALPEAASEGQPAGWQSLSGVRLSFTPAANVAVTVTVHGLRARACGLTLIRGQDSISDANERNAARSAAARWSRWLDDLGLPHITLADRDVSDRALRDTRVAVLPYNPTLSRREILALGRLVDNGGQLLVCYSSEPRLAKIMGLELDAYQAASRPGQWQSFDFNPAAPPHVPPAVFQETRHIRPARPADRNARVIADWRDAAGAAAGDPAWVRSPHGFWMSYILTEGDEPAKKQMILALLGALDPELWRDAAGQTLRDAGRVASFPGPSAALAGIRRLDRGRQTEPLLARAQQLADRLRDAAARQAHADTVAAGRELKAALTEAYAAVQQPRAPEFRGAWNHAGMGLFPGDWNATCRLLAESGFTAVFPNLAWAGTAHYRGRQTPASWIAGAYGDQLQQSAAAARRYGLELHVWKVCWNLGQAPAGLVEQLRRGERLQRDAAGRELRWLCPSHPANQARELAQLEEIMDHAAIAGLHLDYVRYPSAQACFCDGCRQRFERRTGRPVRRWPEDVRSGPRQDEFAAWRTGQLTAFVRAARDLTRRRQPDLKLSAAVYPRYPACADSLGQDWGRWLQQDLLDFVSPMDYTGDPADFALTVQSQLALPGAAGRVFPGIGVTAAESRLAPDRVLEQILLLREAGAGGFMLFDLNRTLEKDVLPLLRRGLTRPEH